MKELHLFVLWERARYQQDRILKDIQRHFIVLKKYAITWTPEMVSSNFSRFYGVNLPNESMKEKECGKGEFLLIIVEDAKPHYNLRNTSHGVENVNVNMFDAKERYRSWTGGGHKVHATNNTYETNHDITLLLGVNVEDFKKKNYDLSIEYLKRDIVGAYGWQSLKQVFYVLNSTIKYVLLRGEDEVNSGIFSEEHRDIDLLIENYQEAKYIINGVSSCSVQRPHEKIVIEKYEYFFDLWVISRNYYDIRWTKKMMKNRYLRNGIFVMKSEDSIYSLLYHALIIKGFIAKEYKKKIDFIKCENGKKSLTYESMLVNFLKDNDYEITSPSDSSICIHLEKDKIKEYAYRYGKMVSLNYQDEEQKISFFSVVYERQNSYYKRGSRFLIENETSFLKKLYSYEVFPALISYGVNKSESYLETKKIQGENVFTFFSNKKHLRYSYIKSFIEEVTKILEILTKERIVHRDFIEKNLILQEKGIYCRVSLIDFGWSINKDAYKECVCPCGLGEGYAPKEGCSDLYTFSNVLIKQWPQIKFIRKISEQLKKNIFNGVDDTQECLDILNDVKSVMSNHNILDRYRIFELRHPRIKKIRDKFRYILLSHYVIQ